MINEQYNYDDNFFRMVSAALVKTLHTSIGWINYFHDKKIRVVVPFYLALPGSEKYLLDAFIDDIVDARIELNTDQIPRGVVTFNSFSTDISQFANPNEYLLNKREVNGQMKAFLQKTKAVPVKAQYDVEIVLNSEIDVLKCSEKLLNTLFNYMFFNIDYYGMKIDAVFSLPDDKEVEIQREITMDSDYKKRIKFPLTVETYYPIFLVEKDRYIDIDDFIICDNDDELDWSRLYKKRPSEMDANDISSVRRVYWKSYLWDYDYRNDPDKLKGDNTRTNTPKENF
jgi:hypothetical protein